MKWFSGSSRWRWIPRSTSSGSFIAAKDKIAIPFSNINCAPGSGCFSARIALRQTQRKAFLFPMGLDRSIVRHWEEGQREPRGFSGIAVWQTADVLYTRVSLCLSLLYLLPCPFASFASFLCFMDSSRSKEDPLLRIGVFTIRQALSNAQMTLIDMSVHFFPLLFYTRKHSAGCVRGTDLRGMFQQSRPFSFSMVNGRSRVNALWKPCPIDYSF